MSTKSEFIYSLAECERIIQILGIFLPKRHFPAQFAQVNDSLEHIKLNTITQ